MQSELTVKQNEIQSMYWSMNTNTVATSLRLQHRADNARVLPGERLHIPTRPLRLRLGDFGFLTLYHLRIPIHNIEFHVPRRRSWR